jgi:hypothetical protein
MKNQLFTCTYNTWEQERDWYKNGKGACRKKGTMSRIGTKKEQGQHQKYGKGQEKEQV